MNLKHLSYSLIFLIIIGTWIVGCQAGNNYSTQSVLSDSNNQENPMITQVQMNDEDKLLAKYSGVKPQQWGENVSGVVYNLDSSEKVIALTMDACGGSGLSAGYDSDLINYLDKMQIPATLFVSGKWIDANPKIFQDLVYNDLFEIGNHGLNHLPCSVNGKSAYGIKGTTSLPEMIQEVTANGEKIESLSGHKPHYYRSGTNYYDEIAVSVTKDLGYKTIGYSVLGDAGATFSRLQVKKALLGARAGSIVILHFNHPEGDTAEGIMDAIPILLDEGFRFVRLSDYQLKAYLPAAAAASPTK